MVSTNSFKADALILGIHPDGERMRVRFPTWPRHRVASLRYFHVPIPDHLRDALYRLDCAYRGLPIKATAIVDHGARQYHQLHPRDWQLCYLGMATWTLSAGTTVTASTPASVVYSLGSITTFF